MSAADELRRMLDERGVEWWAEDDPEDPPYYLVTKWFSNANEQTFEEIPAIRSRSLKAFCITPEQAIEATLGRGECEIEYVSDWMGWHCKSCDALWQGLKDQPPRFCKECGRKVKR